MTTGHPFPPPVVGEVQAGSAAETAGFQPGDTIVEVNDRPIYRFAEMSVLVQRHGGEEMRITVDKGGRRHPPADRGAARDHVREPGRRGTIELYRIGIGRGDGPVRTGPRGRRGGRRKPSPGPL